MIPVIMFTNENDDNIVTAVGAVVFWENGEIRVFQHGDPDPDAYWVTESGVTIDDIERAINTSFLGRCVGRVVATGTKRPEV